MYIVYVEVINPLIYDIVRAYDYLPIGSKLEAKNIMIDILLASFKGNNGYFHLKLKPAGLHE